MQDDELATGTQPHQSYRASAAGTEPELLHFVSALVTWASKSVCLKPQASNGQKKGNASVALFTTGVWLTGAT
jgi:hypothetical protein